ncbi:MAG: HPr family phosphocarrier protein [Opitutales bacterium]|nr:HPr family phosphocarrier protein [Opitutales bacterium]
MESQESSSPDSQHTIELIVKNRMGIHARPAAMIVRIANRFPAELYVEKDEEQVNGKSIMGLMMLAAGQGSKLRFTTIGEGGKEMIDEMEKLFERKFDEP